MVAEAIARSLSEGNDVEVVTEAQHALSRIAAGQHYDVLLCDLMMPVMTGMDLYAEVVRIAPKLASRLVFMTGGAFTARARAFVECGQPVPGKATRHGQAPQSHRAILASYRAQPIAVLRSWAGL